VKNKKRETFIFKGLGFPIKLINVPMKKVVGEWVLDINFNKLQLAVLCSLIRKPAPLTGDELKFMRKFLNLSTTDFGKIFGVTHVAVVKWESGKTRANLSTDVCIRLYLFDHLIKAKDKDFRNLYHEINPEVLSKNKNEKIDLIVIDDFEELKSA
jgi:transcriptional regulator with XRE-family HTH domain